MKFQQLVDRAKAELGDDLTRALELNDERLTAVVSRIVRSSIEGIGFHFANDGEVCDPRPKPVIVHPYNKSPRWTGQGARRRR